MTVRFKCQSEYQKSYRVPRSRSVSPQRCAPFAGLRSGQMGINREPGLQRRKRLGPTGLAQSCTSLLSLDPQHPLTEQTYGAHRRAPSAAARSRSGHRKELSLEPGPPTPPEYRAEPESPVEPKASAGPRPAAEPGRPGKSKKPHASQPDSQPQPSPLTAEADGQQPSANELEHALKWRAGLRSGGQRSGGQRSEYHRQFSWKKPTAASPILTAEQVLYSSSRSVPPFKKNPVSMETEYQRSFQGIAPPTKPRLRKHLEHQRVPLFHTHTNNKKRREGSQGRPRPNHNVPTPKKDDTTPSSLQVQRGHRMLTEYETSFCSPLYRSPEKGGAMDDAAPQVTQLRQQASSYRRRAWGTNFSRDHLSQLRSEHNVLWEPTDTTDSATGPPTPRLTFDLCQDPHSRSTSCVEALDLASRSSASSKRSSVVGSGQIHNTNKNTQTNAQIKAQTSPNPGGGRRMAWGEEEEENKEEEEDAVGENTNEEEGRLPTPRLKMRPVQRTHHDLTTPATGGAILVGKLKFSDESSPHKQRSGSAVSMAAGADTTGDASVKRREAWSENNHPPSLGSSPDHKPPSKAIKMKQTPPSPVAPPPLVPPPLHCIQGTLRHPDFQHNGELGLRFRELLCPGGGCGSDEDDRLSVMSWRSAASCSMASTVLERAQKRGENFWGKR